MTSSLADRLQRLSGNIPPEPAPELSGRLTRMVGLTLECVGCPMVVGDRCLILGQGDATVEAEVVGFEDDRVYLMPGWCHCRLPARFRWARVCWGE